MSHIFLRIACEVVYRVSMEPMTIATLHRARILQSVLWLVNVECVKRYLDCNEFKSRGQQRSKKLME